MVVTEGAVDGRRLRRQLNREAVLDALVELFEEGVFAPTTDDVAERAGISPRSLFRYFDDVDDLHHAAVDRQLALARPLLELDVSAGASTVAKIEALVEARIRLHESTEAAARSVRLAAHRHPVLAEQLHEGRAFLRRQVRDLFAVELRGDRASLLPAVDALCSFEVFDLLRIAQGMSRARTAATLVEALTALLRPDPDPPSR
jgi:AcrR family transcriptional regulator